MAVCDHVSFLRYPLDNSFKVFGRKWAGPVLMEILSGTNRFNTLLRSVQGISPRTLSARLDDLEKLGLVKRSIGTNSSEWIEYALTKKGEDMRHLVQEMATFSLKWYGDRTESNTQV